MVRHADATVYDETDVRALVDRNDEFQRAVAANDADTLDRILSDDFVLYTSRGTAVAKSGILDEARLKGSHYECNDSSDVRARVWGDTGVVTALLHEKGVANGKPFDAAVRFTDVYVRTDRGWVQVSAHASLAPA
jgi:ketosteroid isomerase-like protein